MKAIFLTTAATLIAIASPANAQLLGGGGGMLGGAPIPALPTLPSPSVVPAAPISTATTGSATAAGNATTSKTVDTRSGKANASGSASGSADLGLTKAVNAPLSSATANATGSGSAAGSANADAQLIGTDAVRGLVGQTRDAAGNTITTYRDRAGTIITTTRDRAGNLLATSGPLAGSAQGGAAGSGSGSLNGLSQNLALAGSAAANGVGTFDVKPGTNLFDMQGEKIGKVQEVFADADGRVKGLLVKTEEGTALLPVQNFAADGEDLVTSLSPSQIAASGAGQANGSADGTATGIFSGLSQNLALASSAAGNATGSFDVKKGTQLFDMNGQKIGKVKEVVADANGRVRALVVKVKDSTATLPVSNFAANGDMLVTVMSQAQVTSAANQQSAATPAPSN